MYQRRGKQCANGAFRHGIPEECAGECIHPDWDDYDADRELPMNQLKYEEFPVSIVTVVQYTEYRPEACYRDYVEPDEKVEEKKGNRHERAKYLWRTI
jgi:hypothetical protein